MVLHLLMWFAYSTLKIYPNSILWN